MLTVLINMNFKTNIRTLLPEIPCFIDMLLYQCVRNEWLSAEIMLIGRKYIESMDMSLCEAVIGLESHF